jgi:hypothetical protein
MKWSVISATERNNRSSTGIPFLLMTFGQVPVRRSRLQRGPQ